MLRNKLVEAFPCDVLYALVARNDLLLFVLNLVCILYRFFRLLYFLINTRNTCIHNYILYSYHEPQQAGFMAMYRATLWYMGRWGQKIASRTQFDFINF